MELDPTRMCELLVGLPDVKVLAVDDVVGEPLRVHVETREPRPACPSCGGDVSIKDRPPVELVDLAVFGRRARLVWRKHRWSCPSSTCSMRSWTGEHPAIAAPRLGMTDRAGRWVTEQVGRHGRTVNQVGRHGRTVNEDRCRARLRLAHHQRHGPCLRHSAHRGPGPDRRTHSARVGRDVVLPGGHVATPVVVDLDRRC